MTTTTSVYNASLHTALGLILRLCVAFLLPWMLDEFSSSSSVGYTDIDYGVYLDAASLVREGESPYLRHTYRYTPFLAVVLSLVPYSEFGRILFCVCDAVCGWLLCVMSSSSSLSLSRRRQCQDDHTDEKDKDNDGIGPWWWWLYNPLAINICTRGSAESFLVLLPVLSTLYVATSSWSLSWSSPTTMSSGTRRRALVCGILHGISIHSKLYPILYVPSYMAYLARQSLPDGTPERMDHNTPTATATPNPNPTTTKNPTTWTHVSPRTDPWTYVTTWARRVLRGPPLLFLGTSLATAGALTMVGSHWYGPEAIEAGLRYHLSRLDHRHNYSAWWYPIYLGLGRSSLANSFFVLGTNNDNNHDRRRHPPFLLVSSLALTSISQVLALILCATQLAPHDLPLALFVQTFLFVHTNRVLTGQYFVWYLVFLPLCQFRFREFAPTTGRRLRPALPTDVLRSATALGVSILAWLAAAYHLELKGHCVYRTVWAASMAVLVTSLNLLRALLAHHHASPIIKNHPHKHNKHNKHNKRTLYGNTVYTTTTTPSSTVSTTTTTPSSNIFTTTNDKEDSKNTCQKQKTQ